MAWQTENTTPDEHSINYMAQINFFLFVDDKYEVKKVGITYLSRNFNLLVLLHTYL